jgi:NAD(P)-dependent dehydrogenase (short-subunit alcohol dehydrogenase family)
MFNPLDLSGVRILVTGASSGIGQGTAVLLSRLNAQVVCLGRNAQALAETKARMAHGEHSFFQFDLTAVEEIPGWMKSLAAAVGPLHGLVHCAGVNRVQPLKSLSHSDYSAIMAINLEAAIMLTKGFRQKAVCPSGGSVVFISSVAALKGEPGIAAYAASKGALLSLARTLALELARDGIRVNCLCPGIVRTPMTDRLKSSFPPEAIANLESRCPPGTPDDVGYAAAFFLSNAARWITGATLTIDGGYTA